MVPVTEFRAAEKRFRRFRTEAALLQAEASVVDATDAARCAQLFDAPETRVGELRVLTSTRRPGVMFLPSAIAPADQAAWVSRAVREYTALANPSNLDPHYRFPAAGAAAGADDTRWHFGRACACDVGGGHTCRTVFGKLRWVTLGWHYDWTAKVYVPGRVGVFPPELATLMRSVAAAAAAAAATTTTTTTTTTPPAHDGNDVSNSDGDPRGTAAAAINGDPRDTTTTAAAAAAAAYRAEAAIVNFYHAGDTLSGHNDHSEEDHRAPLISLSLGLSALFLLGGLTRDEPPTPLLLRSGDILIMQDAARLSFHGVPAVFADSTPPELVEALQPLDAGAVADYIAHSRVNINVRQVFV